MAVLGSGLVFYRFCKESGLPLLWATPSFIIPIARILLQFSGAVKRGRVRIRWIVPFTQRGLEFHLRGGARNLFRCFARMSVDQGETQRQPGAT